MAGLPENRGNRSRIPDLLIRTALQHPWGVLASWFTLFLLITPGLTTLQIETSTDSVLDRNHPDWAAYQDTQDLFGADELLVVALKTENPLDPAALEWVKDLSQELEGLEGVRRVDSLATMPIVGVDSDGSLDLTTSLESAPDDPEALQHYIRGRLENDRVVRGSLISDDERVLAINILLERGQENRHPKILDEIRKRISKTSAILSGVPVFRIVASEKTSSEVVRFVPITAALIAIMIGVLFRSILAICLSLLPGFLASWFVLGIMGYTGAPLSITTMILPSITIALGCAYAMHPLVAVGAIKERDSSGRLAVEKLEEAMLSVALPIALSGLTTAIGFLSMSLLRIEAVHATGLYGAIGVLAVSLLTLTLLPATLRISRKIWFKPTVFNHRDRIASVLLRLAQRRQMATLMIWAGLSFLALLGLSRIEVQTDATRWLPPGHEVRDSYEDIREYLSGISPMNVVITAPAGKTILEPGAMEAIDALSASLEKRPDVGQTLTITDPLRQIAGSLTGKEEQPLPKSIAQAEQFLMLLESMDHIDDLITSDRSSANILIRANNNGSRDLRRIATYVDWWWDKNGIQDYSAGTTGIMYEFARAQDEIAYGQIRGLAVALAVISVILFSILKWPALSAASIIPNLIPLFMIFGALGLLGLPLDAGTVLIGCLALGIAVDDTIHIAMKFNSLSKDGFTSSDALQGALSSVLPAILSTTVIIGIAFAVIGLSEFTVTRNLGLLTAAIMGICLIADLTIFPALLVRLKPKKNGPIPRSNQI